MTSGNGMESALAGLRVLAYDAISPRVADDARIAPGVTLIGDIEIGAGTVVGYGCLLRADVNLIRVGARSQLADGIVVHVSPGDFPTLIGDDIVVGPKALLHGCTLQNAAWVGAYAIVPNGCVVEGEAIVAAGSRIKPRTRVRRGEVWGGSPARHLRNVRDGELRRLRAAGGAINEEQGA